MCKLCDLLTAINNGEQPVHVEDARLFNALPKGVIITRVISAEQGILTVQDQHGQNWHVPHHTVGAAQRITHEGNRSMN